MTDRQAVKRAEKLAEKMGKCMFVYVDKSEPGGFDYCTDFDYYHGARQWVRENDVIWSSADGYY